MALSLCAWTALGDQATPTITSIHPPGGPATGGTLVTVLGTNFQQGATVLIGNSPLTNVVFDGTGKVTGLTTSRAAGVTNVIVTNPDTGLAILRKAFTYTDGFCCRFPSFATTALAGASDQPPPSIVAGHFSGDGHVDIVSPANDFNAYYVGNATPAMTPVQTFPSAGNPAGSEMYDMNGDAIDDVALAALGGPVTIFLGGAGTAFQQQRTIAGTAHAFSLDSADFNGDGTRDLVIPDYPSGDVRICLSIGGGPCAVSSTYSIGLRASGVATGDFNGDQHVDIAVSNDANDTVTIMRGNGLGGFTVGSPFPAGIAATEVMGLAIGYLNCDGVLDLAVSTGAVLLGDGDGTFTAAAPLPVTNGRHVAITDFNNDGKRDIAIDSSLTAVHVMLGDGNGGFVAGPVIAVAGGQYQAFAVPDVGAEGSVDLVIGGAPVVAYNTVTNCPAITLGPATLPEGTAGEQFNVTFTASGSAGVTVYKIAGTLPAGLSLIAGTLSGTPTQTGVFPIAVTATDANGCSVSRNYNLQVSLCTTCPPVITSAFANTLSTVQLSWTAVEGADAYEVTRSSQGNPFLHIASPTGTTYGDSVASGQIYIYRVRAVLNGQDGPDSGPAIASTIGFAETLTVRVTAIKAQHLLELRAAVNVLRDAANLAPYSFSDPNPAGVNVKAVHITELRSALNAARTAIGVTAAGFSTTATAGASVRATHFLEIRNALE